MRTLFFFWICAGMAPAQNLSVRNPAFAPSIKSGGAVTYTVTEDASAAAGSGDQTLRSDVYEVKAQTIKATSTYQPTKIGVWLKKNGSPTGAITVSIYQTSDAGATKLAPDDLDVVATATLDASTLTGTFTEYPFLFSGAATWTSGKWYNITVSHDGGTGTDNVALDHAGFVSSDWNIWGRAAAPPATPNDAANWGNVDNNGALRLKVYKSP